MFWLIIVWVFLPKVRLLAVLFVETTKIVRIYETEGHLVEKSAEFQIFPHKTIDN